MMASAVACLVLVIVHLSAGQLRFLDVIPRSRWLSAAGGASIAYIFVHLLPELAEGQRHLNELQKFKWLERHVYLLALTGLVLFYSLERYVRFHRQRVVQAEVIPPPVFWLHIGSFTLYNALIGYLLGRGEEPVVPYAVAMSLHFLVTDYGLRHDHAEIYRQKGRWVVSAGIVLGWCLATFGAVLPQAVIAALTAFVGGSVILNVLKEELPSERESRLSAFFAGVVGYTGLLLLI